jgi:protocatechuate 3,4-dioxygenase beta subunit
MTIAGIALFLLLAQNVAPQQPAVPAAPASIEGVVARAVTGESIPRVTVTLTEVRSSPAVASQLQSLGIAPNSSEYTLLETTLNRTSNPAGQTQVTMTTTSDGRFLFENLKPGTYSLKAGLGGYVTAEYGQRGPNGRGMNVALKAGQKMQGISLTMTPGGTITGHVVDANGDPLGRALVQAQKLAYTEQGRSLVTVQAVSTDDKGEYRLYWLPPGQYYISAVPSDDRTNSMTALPLGAGTLLPTAVNIVTGTFIRFQPGMKVNSRTLSNGDVVEEATVPMFYPATLDVSTATPVDIRPGGVISGIDITTRSERVYRIRGTFLSAATGKPVAASQIILMQRNGTTSSQANTVPQNSNSSGFEIAGVLPGSYLLMAMGSEGPGQIITALSPIEVQGNLENVIITGSSSFAIQGHISTVDTISSASNPRSYPIRVEPQLSGLPNALTLGSNLVARQDNFVIPIALSADYRVTVSTPPNTYVQSIRFGGQDVLRDGLHINGPTNETLEIVVSPNAGRLEGDVAADRQKFSNATVVLMPTSSLRQQTNLYRTVQSNAEGHFTFENIPPGTYKVFAWEDVETFAWFDAEFMRNFENRGREVVIREGAKENIELTVIPR